MSTPTPPPDFVDRVSSNTEALLTQIVKAIGVPHFEISDGKVLEVAVCLLKDLMRLAITQLDDVADTKYAAYWAFWIRKLKPIRVAWADDAKTKEITDINERAALELAIATVKQAGKHEHCGVRSQCPLSCDGAACVERYTNTYFTVNKNYYSEYIIYSMGKRTFGPHHLCSVLDAILFAACGQPAGNYRHTGPTASASPPG